MLVVWQGMCIVGKGAHGLPLLYHTSTRHAMSHYVHQNTPYYATTCHATLQHKKSRLSRYITPQYLISRDAISRYITLQHTTPLYRPYWPRNAISCRTTQTKSLFELNNVSRSEEHEVNWEVLHEYFKVNCVSIPTSCLAIMLKSLLSALLSPVLH